MANLANTRRNFQNISTVLGVVAGVAALIIFLPLRPSAEQKTAELNAAKLETKRLETEVAPLQGLPEKLGRARGDIASFYKERFPDRFSAIPEVLGKLSSEHGVRLTDVKYEAAETELTGLQQVTMDAGLSGDYAKVVSFINALERSQTFFLIDSITLGDEGGGGDVRLQIRIISVLRSGATTVARAQAGERP